MLKSDEVTELEEKEKLLKEFKDLIDSTEYYSEKAKKDWNLFIRIMDLNYDEENIANWKSRIKDTMDLIKSKEEKYQRMKLKERG